jgi:amphi-Trp domain-containing protein
MTAIRGAAGLQLLGRHSAGRQSQSEKVIGKRRELLLGKEKMMAEEDVKDVEKSYATKEVVAKLRRLEDALVAGKTFELQIAGERIYVPADAAIEFEYERDGDDEEIEIEVRWKRK